MNTEYCTDTHTRCKSKASLVLSLLRSSHLEDDTQAEDYLIVYVNLINILNVERPESKMEKL